MSDEPKVYVILEGDDFNRGDRERGILGVFSSQEKADTFLSRYPESTEYMKPEIKEFPLDGLESVTLLYLARIFLGSGAVEPQMPKIMKKDDDVSNYTGNSPVRESFPPTSYATICYASTVSQEDANQQAKDARNAWLKQKVKEIQ